MGNVRLWLRASGTMAMVMLVGWGLMKTTSPSAENLMQVRFNCMDAYLWVQSQVNAHIPCHRNSQRNPGRSFQRLKREINLSCRD